MKVKNDHRSKFFNLSNWKEEVWSKSGLNKLTSLPMCGFIAQLVEQRTGNAEVTGSNLVEALICFRLLLSNCLNWKIYCDDHSSLSSTTAVQKWIILYSLHQECLYHITCKLTLYRCSFLIPFLLVIPSTSDQTPIFQYKTRKFYSFRPPKSLHDFTLSSSSSWSRCLLSINWKVMPNKYTRLVTIYFKRLMLVSLLTEMLVTEYLTQSFERNLDNSPPRQLAPDN